MYALPLALLFTLLSSATPSAPRAGSGDSTSVRDLPIVELHAKNARSDVLVVILSGDGGWADIDQQVGQRLQARGIDVVGFDMRDYLQHGTRTPEGTARDVGRVAWRYMGLWRHPYVVLIGYSRGADLAPFVANRLRADIKPRLKAIAMLTLLERASFNYHFSDLWRTTSRDDDTPVLPELQQLHNVKLLCVYGKKEKESLCRTAPAGLMTVIAREGAHHFDGNYDAIADIIYESLIDTPPRAAAASAAPSTGVKP